MNQHSNVKLALKKTLLQIIVIFMISSSLMIGCSNNKSKEKEIDFIEITQHSNNKVWTLSDKDTITNFINALNNREETNEKIDIRSPDYSVKIYFTNKSSEEYTLWIDKDINVQGVLMSKNKTWFIKKESNSIFKEIFIQTEKSYVPLIKENQWNIKSIEGF
ncbi:MAG: hypothetical protein F8N39_12245 [Clostridiaceae bacterium]|nr:hypothetical protein [Clostridiaceae bacterium]